ncbi:MAG: hypothetical protein ACOX2O_05650 [Bdellovibrionota bacterium]|jgi:hypothetical protein
MLTETPDFSNVSQPPQPTFIDGVSFDTENITLHGIYSDELSAYRAKKMWIETFEDIFLLEQNHDISLSIHREEDGRFLLLCEFLTACARYAFWRVTNNQAPEAQYSIETAHIPICDSRQDEILHAPDLRPLHGSSYNTSSPRTRKPTTLPEIFKTLLEKIRNS